MSQHSSSNGSIIIGGIVILVVTLAIITGVTGSFGQWFWLPLVVFVLANSSKNIR